MTLEEAMLGPMMARKPRIPYGRTSTPHGLFNPNPQAQRLLPGTEAIVPMESMQYMESQLGEALKLLQKEKLISSGWLASDPPVKQVLQESRGIYQDLVKRGVSHEKAADQVSKIFIKLLSDIEPML